jgi:hypothetical protein
MLCFARITVALVRGEKPAAGFLPLGAGHSKGFLQCGQPRAHAAVIDIAARMLAELKREVGRL